MNSNNGNQFEFLDLITIMGFLAQVDNMSKDESQTKYIHKVIKTIALEIDKLHKENDIIIKQNEEIIKLLKTKKLLSY